MRKALAVAVAVLALVSGACGKSKDSATTATSTPDAGPVTVMVGNTVPDLTADTFAYFPKLVTVHPGDTVTFKSAFHGEPHTVTFAKGLQGGLKAYGTIDAETKKGNKVLEELQQQNGPPTPAQIAKLSPELQAAVKAVDEINAFPSLLPDGPGDADQRASNPCFLATGELPANDKAACPKSEQPAFTGTETMFSSGFLPDQAEFAVKLADTIAPGEYRYTCLLHKPDMQGTITVVAKGQPATSATDAADAASKQLDELKAKLAPLHDKAAATPVTAAVAGLFDDSLHEGYLAEFGPPNASIKAGSSVTWTINGPHTISFNAPEDAVGIFMKATDGTFHTNPKQDAPAASAGAPPPGNGPPPSKPIAINGGKFDGKGYKSSGGIISFGPPGYTYKVTFTKAGTYAYRCLIHPDMKATITVT